MEGPLTPDEYPELRDGRSVCCHDCFEEFVMWVRDEREEKEKEEKEKREMEELQLKKKPKSAMHIPGRHKRKPAMTTSTNTSNDNAPAPAAAAPPDHVRREFKKLKLTDGPDDA